MGVRTYSGGCHCGAVRFEVELDLEQGVSRCNCAMCTKLSCANAQVKPDRFRLVAGADSLTMYQRPSSPMEYPFCKHCGVHSFGSGDLPQLGGKFVTIHVNALDGIDLATLAYRYWDGRHDNWAAGPRDRPWPVQA
jgi:hypothetical protein